MTDITEKKKKPKKKTKKKPNPKQRCPNCNRAMKQQFIGLKHCKCGTSWQKGTGYFERTSDMVFALERRVVKKSKNSVKATQVPVIRYRNTNTSNTENGIICEVCMSDMQKSDGCTVSAFIHDETVYHRYKVGDINDFFEDCEPTIRCGDCNAKYGHYHHEYCDCEHCPVCDGQLLSCGCEVKFII